MTTVTTVGYGDMYPVTTTGRLVALAPMIGGITLPGAVTAIAAQIEALRKEIRQLTEHVGARESQMGGSE